MKYLGSITNDNDLVNKKYVDNLAIDTSLFGIYVDNNGDLSLSYDDSELGTTSITPTKIGAVPTSRTINSKALSSNITLSASDVGAVPTTRTVNNKVLSSNITLSASDVGALDASNKMTMSSAGSLGWTNQTDGDAKIPAKSVFAWWNGAYNGTSSNLKYCYNGVMIGGSQITREGFNTACTAKSVAANGGTITVTCTKAKSGWLPIGLAGIDVSTPSGLAVRRAFISASSSGSVTVTVDLTNTTGSAISVTTSHVVACYIMWARIS